MSGLNPRHQLIGREANLARRPEEPDPRGSWPMAILAIVIAILFAILWTAT